MILRFLLRKDEILSLNVIEECIEDIIEVSFSHLNSIKTE